MSIKSLVFSVPKILTVLSGLIDIISLLLRILLLGANIIDLSNNSVTHSDSSESIVSGIIGQAFFLVALTLPRVYTFAKLMLKTNK